MRNDIIVCAAIILFGLFYSGVASADASGQFPLSGDSVPGTGGGHQCANISQATIFISFPRALKQIPGINDLRVSGHASGNDRVNVSIADQGRFGFIVNVTTIGSSGNEVCGDAGITWTVSNNDLSELPGPNVSGDYLIAGSSEGCKNQPRNVDIKYEKPFDHVPNVAVWTTESGNHDNPAATIEQTYVDGFVLQVNPQGNICGGAWAHWSTAILGN